MSVGGDQIDVGTVNDSGGVAVGRGAQAVRVENVSGTLVQAHGLVQSSIITAGTITIEQQSGDKARRLASRRQVLAPAEFYVSRPEIEDHLAELLKRPSEKLNVVGLYGLPGVGSSMLGRRVALDLEDEFPDGTLWVDVEGKSEFDILCRFIEPYEMPAERSPFHDVSDYLQDLQRVLVGKRVLIVLNQVGPENGNMVSKVLPQGIATATVLVIATAPLPGLFPEENSICLQELAPDQAVQLFRNIWRGGFAATSPDVVQSLAQELSYLPHQIVLVARDIVNRQIAPQDYLEELRRNKLERQHSVVMDHPGLQTVFENLPPMGKQVFPYIGVVGTKGWTHEALVAVSQLKRRDVETGTRQLISAGFLKGDGEGGYRCSPVVRRFALSLLREIGGDALIRSTRAGLARHILRQARETSRIFRESLLDDFLKDVSRQKRFNKALTTAFLPASVKGQPGESVPLRSRPGLAENDIIQDVFEQVVFDEPEFLQRWAELLNSKLCQRQRSLLQDALTWAVEKEDWSLVRRFATLSMSALDTDLKKASDGDGRQPVSISEFAFGPIRESNLSGVMLDSILLGVRMIDTLFDDCEMVSTRWTGVHLYRPALLNVDMVNAHMPGLVVRDGTFENVDARGADLRGAIFYNCYLEDVNFRFADLSSADFIHCKGGKIDLRNTNLRGITVVSSEFTDVILYEADQSIFQPLLGPNRPAEPPQDQG